MSDLSNSFSVVKNKKPALMIQGTTSNAGKSILTTAFCRIFTRKGYAVAPFKAQNMSLNSFVTYDGNEMGRAQVVQAQGCRRDPDVRMNPILLKPNSNTGSQIIVMGKPIGSMNFHEYTLIKKELVATIHKAYDELAQECDIMMLEGAGSPAEINLKANDIVNMAMAKYSEASVLLCGDIDRGGVYAHFLGTMMCLDAAEQELVKGFLVNRFRGDASLLTPAHEFVLQKTGKPVLGTIPYLSEIAIPDEDSVSFKNGIKKKKSSSDCAISIAFIDLPHISNATDIDPFYLEPDVNITIASEPQDLDDADVIIIPGSKNVIDDLLSLNTKGIAQKIIDRVNRGSAVLVGVCGGFQMLGKTISDPYGIENQKASEVRGLDFLDINTVLERDKTLTLATAYHPESASTIKGYEIHHGRTVVGADSFAIMQDSEQLGTGARNHDNTVWGTYLHGLFDNDMFRRYFIDSIRTRKGFRAINFVQATYNLDSAIDRLADCVEDSVDMQFICKLLGLK
jgi:adenosylcobyric acid synthase